MPRILNDNAEAQPEALVTWESEQFFKSLMVITLSCLSPKTLGALLALYEHKTAFLERLLGIKPFDQPGVEFGEKICETYLGCES